jgi:hypothetical protein
MSAVEILLTLALAWVVLSSAAALMLCYRWRLDERREKLALKFDPVSIRGIERGDIRSLKIGGRK